MRVRKLIWIVIIICIFYTVNAQAANASETTEYEAVSITVDGISIDSYRPAFLYENTTMVPFRAIFEALDTEVGYEAETETAYGIRDGVTVRLTRGSRLAIVNNEVLELPVPVIIIDGTTMVPARFIAESLGARVDWDNDTNTVVITSKDQLFNIVAFTDSKFEKAVRNALNINEGNIYAKDMLSISEFEADRQNISDIWGIQYMKNLKKLTLIGNNISDLTPLSALNLLEELEIQNNEIKDLTPVSNMEHLTYLDVSSNYIRDISPVRNNMKLETFAASGNLISNISPVINLPYLQLLDISKNQIMYLPDLSKLKNLVLLDIEYNPLLDVATIKDLPDFFILFTDEYIDKNAEREEIIATYDLLNNKIREMVEQVLSPDMTDYEKVLALHDALVEDAQYNSYAVVNDDMQSEDHTHYGVFMDGMGVCDGYAMALHTLLQTAGINSIFVTGEGYSNESWAGHAWNIIELNGKYYHIDPTWDDPTVNNEIGNLSHKYFLVSDQRMGLDHKWDRDKYPECEDNFSDYSLKRWNGFISEGDWTYTEYKNMLYRISKDGKDRMELSEDKPEYIMLKGDYVYYCNASDGEEIYRIKKDGSDREKISEDRAVYLESMGDYIYYINYSDSNLYRINEDGSKRQKVMNNLCSWFDVDGEMLYYKCFKWEDKAGLYRMNTDSRSSVKYSEFKPYGYTLENNGKTVSFSFDEDAFLVDGWIYCRDEEGLLHRISVDGAVYEQLTNEVLEDYEILGGYISYRNAENTYKIIKLVESE